MRYRHVLLGAAKEVQRKVKVLGSKIKTTGATLHAKVVEQAEKNNRACCWRSMPPKPSTVAPAEGGAEEAAEAPGEARAEAPAPVPAGTAAQ